MPDIGLIELALIGLIAFLVIGPERLPDFFAEVAKVVRQGRVWLSSLKAQLDEEKKQITQPVAEAKESIISSVKDVTKKVSLEDKEK